MILGLDTSTPICRVGVGNNSYEWEAGRGLALGLNAYLDECLGRSDATWSDVIGLVVFRGPGSFTGLRIGITVVNTVADTMNIPLIGATGDAWLATGTARIETGENDRVILPLYGSEPHITKPKK